MDVYRYTYSQGYRSRDAAELALDDAHATGDVLPGERPEIEAYSVTRDGRRLTRYRITLAGA